MNKTREQVQSEGLEKLILNNYTGTLVLSTGSGKSKIAIDAIKEGEFKNILITSPRTNLKENWIEQLIKWLTLGVVSEQRFAADSNVDSTFRCIGLNGRVVNVLIENIQTCYKWDKERIKEFDLIIADEIHTIVTPEYSKLLYNASELHIPIIGLTATPDIKNEFKKSTYNLVCPIIYVFTKSSKQGIVNKRRYIVVKYRLSDQYLVKVGTKTKQWDKGEKSQYDYISSQLVRGQKAMHNLGSTRWFNDAREWFWNKKGDRIQQEAARIYLSAVQSRKYFLWKLSSSVDIALKLKERIFNADANNKVLLFSELTEQASKLSPYTIHSKQDSDTNEKLLKAFNDNKIKELSSCHSLTLGLNLTGANYAIMESYNSSDVSFSQKAGRTDRLAIEDVATVIWIVPMHTQSDIWFNKVAEQVDLSSAEYIDLSEQTINDINL